MVTYQSIQTVHEQLTYPLQDPNLNVVFQLLCLETLVLERQNSTILTDWQNPFLPGKKKRE